ncbi:MAG: hypothetical protein J5772_00080 [Clostridia bacterium]|nr:hypothetical protein [Clostridia bacterium]
MPKFIPYKKLSKRKRRELDNEQRGSWGAVNPVTRAIKSRKIYDRKRDKEIERMEE